MTDHNSRDEKRPGATDRAEDESTTLVAASERDARLASIERQQRYTHTLLAATMSVVAGATATLANSTFWALVTVVALAGMLAFGVVWKTTSRTTPQNS
ncbi:hypothetical protein [Halobacterium sp. CBA1132]|uniref:hypothetical protein n=1 Tax=Halobacterium sp. CBA1132 TaxID=1765057 RepID=UPI00073F547D|nr:hypothetical protein [Halobacterium sp. CBA1132]